MNIYLEENPNDTEIQTVVDGVIEYGLSQIDNEQPIKCAFALKKDELVIGGATCSQHVGQFYLDYLWVHADYRNTGYGSLIHQSVLKKARTSNCSGIWVHTLNESALPFYRKLGYIQKGCIKNYVTHFDLRYLYLNIK